MIDYRSIRPINTGRPRIIIRLSRLRQRDQGGLKAPRQLPLQLLVIPHSGNPSFDKTPLFHPYHQLSPPRSPYRKDRFQKRTSVPCVVLSCHHVDWKIPIRSGKSMCKTAFAFTLQARRRQYFLVRAP